MNKFATKDEIVSEMKKIRAEYGFEDDWENEKEVREKLSDNNVKTYDEFWDHYDLEYETFEEEYVTPGGQKVIAFGYYGNEY